ncbi:hypothetical protein KIH27_10735 [Mycobacterium sp. M1]|uniref:Uncharacterized protein n=1 Tax=Mycolicibacter acidiphilus TaxID=2835306 RepID=A0ABS5RIN6_9MYCO|nr:hypothetical protein [Mycolicibacter acidiphilus]MBS9534059.1 hypothetical protein [Mycolicibacter acidiphilus]
MQIEGLFLAEDAQVVDNKLYATGGVPKSIQVPRAGQLNDEGEMAAASYSLVTLMEFGPDDGTRPYRMTTELVDAEGNKRVVADGEIIPVTSAPGAGAGEKCFSVSELRINADKDGRMMLVQTIDGGSSMSIPVTLHIVD